MAHGATGLQNPCRRVRPRNTSSRRSRTRSRRSARPSSGTNCRRSGRRSEPQPSPSGPRFGEWGEAPRHERCRADETVTWGLPPHDDVSDSSFEAPLRAPEQLPVVPVALSAIREFVGVTVPAATEMPPPGFPTTSVFLSVATPALEATSPYAPVEPSIVDSLRAAVEPVPETTTAAPASFATSRPTWSAPRCRSPPVRFRSPPGALQASGSPRN